MHIYVKSFFFFFFFLFGGGGGWGWGEGGGHKNTRYVCPKLYACPYKMSKLERGITLSSDLFQKLIR